MFSSIASFIFGSNTSATTNPNTNCEPTHPANDPERQQRNNNDDHDDDDISIQPEHTIEVTSLTPSVTGSNTSTNTNRGGKRGRNKRNRQQANKNKRQAAKKPTPSITKLLTPSGDSCGEENFDEDDWFIVEKEEEHDEEESLPRTDSEDDVPVVELGKPKSNDNFALVANTANNGHHHHNNNNGSRRRAAHITSHSLYSGPRPQQQHQRNHLQRLQRSGGAGAGAMSLAILSSPPRGNSPIESGGVTQSLYVASHDGGDGVVYGGFGPTNAAAMEESWFVTPPPCFTSIGPIHMETSPFENLLIEHPSMSVYHSIRSAQEATDSFVNLDLGVEESQQIANAASSSTDPSGEGAALNANNGAVVQRRTTGARIDRFSAAQLKQELMARNTQKNREERERQNLCRSAIKRANKVRDFQGKGNRQRRSDMQHCKVVSGANNNRKCCF